MRDIILDYLIKSNFVESYTKKLVYPSDKENLQDDFIQEVWLQICEIPEEKWTELYNRRPNQDEFYDIRNWVSVVIRNTVVSTTSAAFRKLKKQSTVSKQLDSKEWQYLSNIIPDTMTMF
jgi:hypothetical protein